MRNLLFSLLSILMAFFTTNGKSFAQNKYASSLERKAGASIGILDLPTGGLLIDNPNKESLISSLGKFGNKSYSLNYHIQKPCAKGINLNQRIGFTYQNYQATVEGETFNLDRGGVEWEPKLQLNAKENGVFNPYINLGFGAGMYGSKLRPKVWFPIGLGFEVKTAKNTFLFLESGLRATPTRIQYHKGITHNLGLLTSFTKQRKECPIEPSPSIPDIKKTSNDKDGDGILNENDACPDVFGTAEFAGCPDTDGDGVGDNKDKCPTVVGTAKYDGCPMPDKDGDGVADEVDACPTVKGESKYAGCPPTDKDGDGVFDLDDDCPSVAGEKDNKGCPKKTETVIDEVKAEAQEKLNIEAKNIYFETGSAKLTKSSCKSLNNVVAILGQNSEYSLNIEGHTDNVGGTAFNKALSEKRVNSVKNYLVSKGIDEGRINAEGFGEEKPVASNASAAGRAKNRRVVLIIQ